MMLNVSLFSYNLKANSSSKIDPVNTFVPIRSQIRRGAIRCMKVWPALTAIYTDNE